MQPNRKKLGFKDYAKATIPLAHSHIVKETSSDLLPNGFRVGQRIYFTSISGEKKWATVISEPAKRHFGWDHPSKVWAIWDDEYLKEGWIYAKDAIAG